jgi:hypothetical protein
MKIQKLLSIAFLIIQCYFLQGQKADAIDLEIGGPSLVYSVNLDTRFEKSNFGMRIGLGALPYDFPHGKPMFIMPLVINHFIPKKHSVESGFGLTYITTYDDNSIFGNLMLVYRLQKTSGFLFRCGINLLLNFNDEHDFFSSDQLILPLPLISFGKWF